MRLNIGGKTYHAFSISPRSIARMNTKVNCVVKTKFLKKQMEKFDATDEIFSSDEATLHEGGLIFPSIDPFSILEKKNHYDRKNYDRTL